MTRKGSDADLYGVSISLNEIRREDDPMVKSSKATKLLNMGYTIPQIAITFGVSRPTIDNWLALQDVSAPIINAVEAGEISASAAAKLAKFDRNEQVKRFDNLKQQGQSMTVGTVTQAVKSSNNTPAPKLKTRREIEQELVNTAPTDEYTKGFRAALLWVLGQ